MIDFVPRDHLEHLINKYASDDEEALRWQLMLDDRASLLPCLESKEQGVTRRLESMWSFYSVVTVYLWHVPALASLSPENIENKVRVTLNIREPDSLFSDLTPSTIETPDRVVNLRIKSDEIRGKVRLLQTFKRNVDEEDVESFRTRDVKTLITLRGNSGLVEAFAAKRDGKRAVMAILKDAFNFDPEAPENKPKFISIGEERFKVFMSENEMDWIGVSGKDPKDEVGALGFSGKKLGRDCVPLDMNVTKVQLQDLWRNKSRNIGVNFIHPDGYNERVEFCVYFGKASRLTFTRRTSLPAMREFVHRVYTIFCE
ncbi:hypothetical protein FRC91_20095 [Bradymonadales bacterium TMQ1]|nr:hypothetical protein FRC91_20095 [Bradymonadales bacterium TMQ1]